MGRDLASVVLLALPFVACKAGASAVAKWLIVSDARDGHVAYKKIGPSGFLGTGSMTTLISKGLVHPQGLAIDHHTSKLFIADPAERSILAYSLSRSGDTLEATQAPPAMKNVEARWVAVDGSGNLYATDEPSNRILKISAEQMQKGDSNPHVLYDGLSLTSVSGPGGIAVDNYNTFWVNKQIGTQVGSLVRAPAALQQQRGESHSVQALAKNADKSYGLCLAMNNLFYTQPEGTISAVKKTGSDIAQKITNKLSRPRGCAWDGDGTIYVADSGANAVYSFAGDMQNLDTALLQKAVDFENAYGVAVFSGCTRGFGLGFFFLALARYFM